LIIYSRTEKTRDGWQQSEFCQAV